MEERASWRPRSARQSRGSRRRPSSSRPRAPSGIIGDDVEGIAAALEKEIGIPVVAVPCDGFRSRVWATGFDAAYHAILSRIVKPAVVKNEKINIINFWGSDVFGSLLGRLGLAANYVTPFTTIERLERLSESMATVQVCHTLGTYLAAGLEQRFGVPEIKAPAPYGIPATDAWLRELGRVTIEARLSKGSSPKKRRGSCRRSPSCARGCPVCALLSPQGPFMRTASCASSASWAYRPSPRARGTTM